MILVDKGNEKSYLIYQKIIDLKIEINEKKYI
jgi:hypothetical protein